MAYHCLSDALSVLRGFLAIENLNSESGWGIVIMSRTGCDYVAAASKPLRIALKTFLENVGAAKCKTLFFQYGGKEQYNPIETKSKSLRAPSINR
jgi:hypothetical protein